MIFVQRDASHDMNCSSVINLLYTVLIESSTKRFGQAHVLMMYVQEAFPCSGLSR